MKMMKKLVIAAISLTLAITPLSGVSVNASAGEPSSYVEALPMDAEKLLEKASSNVEDYAASQDTWLTDDTTDLPGGTGIESQIINIDGEIVPVAVPSTLSKASQISQKKFAEYVINAPQGYDQDLIIPIKAKSKGALVYALVASYDDDIYYHLYSDKECTKSVYTYDNVAYVEKGGTYYIRVGKYDLNKEGDSRFGLAAGFISGANAVLKNKTNMVVAAFGTKKAAYYKFTVTKTSKITLKVESEYSKYVALCNSKKTAITSEEYISNSVSKAVYAVPKGTYYIRLKATEGLVSMTPTFTTVSSVAGPSREKAGTMKVNGKTQKVTVLPGDSTKKYYYLKFYNPKNQTVYLNINSSYTSGKMELGFYDTKKSNFGTRTIWNGINNTSSFRPYVYYSGNNGYKLPKGTYYVRFQKKDKKTSGIIEVNVKNKKK